MRSARRAADWRRRRSSSSAPAARISSPPARTWRRCSASRHGTPTSSRASGRSCSRRSSACRASPWRSIDGDCFGGALDLILAFDLRFATPRSRFAHPGARLGIVTGFGGTSRWRKVLSRRGRESAVSRQSRALRERGAGELGLVDRVGGIARRRDRAMAGSIRRTMRMVKELVLRAPNSRTPSTLLLHCRRQRTSAEDSSAEVFW